MNFRYLKPFVPSGADFDKALQFFEELGFRTEWQVPGMAGLEREGCAFILQHFDRKEFAENFMLSVGISDARAWYEELKGKDLTTRYGARVAPPRQQPYGLEVNVIDPAGVCWHFVEG